ncbi:hypothetical protein NLU13_5856 [Sarocladium strictum]|uniref:FAD-binding domain-containing protein n=1 Tax=Sarocladium strictum TaxID=5046 RepID=A0AA39GGD8_SARSR|nr:hypothetical protein NLU13_5856 [Sarocladium strictum]
MNNPSVPFELTTSGKVRSIRAPGDDYAIIEKSAADLAKASTRDYGVLEWDHCDRVTVTGDAIHYMTPAGGLAPIAGLRDSELLGCLLRGAGGCCDGLTAGYEKDMGIYGSQAARTSYGIAQTFNSELCPMKAHLLRSSTTSRLNHDGRVPIANR